MMGEVHHALSELRRANPLLDRARPPARERSHRLQKVLVANRGEIAKRFFFVLSRSSRRGSSGALTSRATPLMIASRDPSTERSPA